jgi:Tol biopolymer transport system component
MRRLTTPIAFAILVVIGAAASADTPAPPSDGDISSISEESPQEAYETRRLGTVTVWPWDISPDGRYVTVIDWSTGDMALQDLATDEIRRVTDKGPWTESDEFGGNGKFSPDGTRIAYAWNSATCVEAQSQPGLDSGTLFMEIRVVDQAGSGEPHTLLPCPGEYFMNMAPAAWSPDGRSLLLGFREEDGAARLAILDLASRSVSDVATVPEGGRLRFLRFSPDGRHIVYSAPGEAGQGRDVFSLPVTGGSPSVLVSRPGDDQVLGWAADGSALLVQSQDGLSSGVFRLAVRDYVRPSGEGERVRSGLWRAAALGQTARGYAYVTTIEQPQVHTATLDLETGRILSPSAAVEDPALGESSSGTWSPDGDWLAYIRIPPGGGSQELVIRAVEGGEAREIPLDVQASEGLWWMPDGSGLYVLGTRQDVGQALFGISLESGRLTPILTSPDGRLGRSAGPQLSPASMSPDGRTFVIARSGVDRDQVLAYDLRAPDRAPRDIPLDFERLFIITQRVSPDGRSLAFTRGADDGEEVWIAPMMGGPARMVFKGGMPRNLTWLPDSSALLVWASRRGLLRVPADGSQVEEIADGAFAGVRLEVHPGGEWISFLRGSWKGEVWLMGSGT